MKSAYFYFPGGSPVPSLEAKLARGWPAIFFFLRVCPPSRSWDAAASLLSTWHLRCNADVYVVRYGRTRTEGAAAAEEQDQGAPEGEGSRCVNVYTLAELHANAPA